MRRAAEACDKESHGTKKAFLFVLFLLMVCLLCFRASACEDREQRREGEEAAEEEEEGSRHAVRPPSCARPRALAPPVPRSTRPSERNAQG